MADMTPSHAFSAVAENGMCRHATGFVKMGHIYGCSGLGNCRMLNVLFIAFCVIDLISMLIR